MTESPKGPSGEPAEAAGHLGALRRENADLSERLRAAERRVAEREASLRILESATSAGTYRWNLRTNEVWWSPRTFEIMGFPPGTPPTPASILLRIHPEDTARVVAASQAAIRTGTGEFIEYRLLVDGVVRHVRGGSIVLPGADGRPEVVYGAIEATEAEKALRDRAGRWDGAVRDAHQRARGDLSLLASLAGLHEVGSEDPELRRAHRRSRARLQALALVHEHLARVPGATVVDLGEQVREQCVLASNIYAQERHVELVCAAERIDVGVDASAPLSLVLHELVANAYEHAFPEGRRGRVLVAVRREAGRAVVEVRDDGVGVSERVDLEAPRTLGLRIASTLSRQLPAQLVFERGGGTCARLTF